ncbi:aspartyl-phosphate phosphatase Spo0E family protein [Paenibacillus camerounensis]|uniref:aspartyl-phosphate phosphatase Spo0E family protein n=1 Tax=Paenibacillus camerounensis TaxID=1243663 RepID=UPI000A324497|nr:aspartyl-phosphate phosphatase Spo0E family protein [Paenibacillus camerounensis]
MDKLKILRKQIEYERTMLNQMEQAYGLLHPRVIRQSMKLDELINTYIRMVSGGK